MTSIIFSQEENDKQDANSINTIEEVPSEKQYEAITNKITSLMDRFSNQDPSKNKMEIEDIRSDLKSLPKDSKNDIQYHWANAILFMIDGDMKKALKSEARYKKIESKMNEEEKSELNPLYLMKIEGIEKEPSRVSKFISKLKEDNTDLTYSAGAVMDKIVIDADHISKLPVSSVADILEYVMGVNVYKRGALDGNASLSMMGGSSAQTLILLDGFNIFPGYTHYHDLDFPFSIYDIERIEVTHGVASRFYGPHATSGVINIITKDARDTGVDYNFSADTNVNRNIHGVITKKSEYSNHVLSINNISNTGLIESVSDTIASQSLYYKYIIEDGNNKTLFSYGYLDKGNNFNGAVGDVYTNSKNLSKFANVKVQWDFGKNKVESNLHWNNTEFQIKEDEVGDSYDPTKVNIVDVGYGFRGYRNNRSGGITTLGAMVNMDQYSIIGTREDNNTQEAEIFGDRVTYVLTYDTECTKKNFQYNYGFSLNTYTNANLFNTDQLTTNTRVALGWDINYRFSDNTKLYHSYNFGYRLPSPHELYANTKNMIGSYSRTLYTDADNDSREMLTPERQISYEYGINIDNHRLRLDFAMFYTAGYNTIDWKYDNNGTEGDASDDRWVADNIENGSNNPTTGLNSPGLLWNDSYPSINTNGHKIRFSLLPKAFDGKPMLEPFTRFDISYIFLNVDKSAVLVSDVPEDAAYRYISNYFRHQAVLNTEYKLPLKFHLGTVIRYEEPVVYANPQTDGESFSRFKIDLHLIRRFFFSTELTLSVNNVLDRTYYDESTSIDDSEVWLPGRTINIALRKAL